MVGSCRAIDCSLGSDCCVCVSHLACKHTVCVYRGRAKPPKQPVPTKPPVLTRMGLLPGVANDSNRLPLCSAASQASHSRDAGRRNRAYLQLSVCRGVRASSISPIASRLVYVFLSVIDLAGWQRTMKAAI